MASTYSALLRTERMANGENSATWGTKANTVWDLVEDAIGGISNVAMADANTTLTANTGTADQSRCAILQFTGTLTAGRNIIVPATAKLYTIYNNTTGGFALTVKTSGGTGVAIKAGAKRRVYCDATNVVESITDLPSTATLDGVAFGTAALVADAGLCHLAGTESITGQKNFTLATAATTPPVTAKNTNDNANVQIAKFGGGRATPTANDAGYISLVLNNASSAEKEFGRLDVVGETLTGGAENGRVRVQVMKAGTLTSMLQVTSAALVPSSDGLITLGAAATGFGNTFFSSAKKLDWGNGNVTVTHATGVLTIAGGQLQAAVLGSASTPDYSFSGDATLGMRRSASGAGMLTAASTDIAAWSVLGMGMQGSTDLTLSSTATSFLGTPLSAGYKGVPLGNSNAAIAANYTLALTDNGCCIYHDEVTARTVTIPANASIGFPIGATIVIDNTGNAGAAGALTLSITTDTLRRGDGTAGTGSRTIAASAVVTVRKTKSTEWVITGVFT